MEKKPKDYNPKAPGVRRILREAFELRNSTYQYYAQPLEENIYEWHFTIRGPDDTEFQGGFYHGRILLPNEYPMKPPNFIFLTPNGRFDVNRKICLNISGFHPESWQPCWSIRTVLLAIISFLPVPYDGSVGSIDYPVDERKKLAKQSRKFTCDTCGCNKITELLKPEPVNDEAHNSQWYKDFQVYIQNLTSEHSNQSTTTTTTSSTAAPEPVTVPQVQFEPNLLNQPSEPSSLSSNSETVSASTIKQRHIPKQQQSQTLPSTSSIAANSIQATTTTATNHCSTNSRIIEMLRGDIGEKILYFCIFSTLLVIGRRLILSYLGMDD